VSDRKEASLIDTSDERSIYEVYSAFDLLKFRRRVTALLSTCELLQKCGELSQLANFVEHPLEKRTKSLLQLAQKNVL